MSFASNVRLVGSVKSYVENSIPSGEMSTLENKVNEVAGDPGGAFNGGVLRYNGFFYREYKVGQQRRFFGLFANGDFCMFLIGDHRGNKYEGQTWDGKDKFAVDYVAATNLTDSNTTKAVVKAFGLNTMNSPIPVYD